MIGNTLWSFVVVLCVAVGVEAFAEQGRWTFEQNPRSKPFEVIKGVYKDTSIDITVWCEAPLRNTNVTISYIIGKLPCYRPESSDATDELGSPQNGPDKCIRKSDGYPEFECLVNSKQTLPCDNIRMLLKSENGEPLKTPKSQEKTEAVDPETTAKVSTSTTASSLTSTTVAETVSGNQTHSKKSKRAVDSQHDEQSASRVEKAEGQSEAEAKPGKANAVVQKQAPVVTSSPKDTGLSPQYVIPMDGIFVIEIEISSADNFTARVVLEILSPHGYLSAVDWPLLPFYGTMCVVYFIYGVVWLIVLALQWRDLLRIQFWIGGVILLGMLEKAAFYAEYQSVNSTGNSVEGAVLFAELVSCLKRTLARMLVVIVSLGFGIVKPRLGPMLHRVVGVGGIYFLLCSLEAFLRVMKPKNDPTKTLMLAEIPLAVLDTGICWWIFSNLVQTTRTLRLRRNVVKLSLYRHFTNTLIFACVASVAFMVWVYKAHNLQGCVKDWKELWVDDAYWHLLFSVILLVIMILWRPTNNNQRYAFMPLIDSADEEEDAVLNDAFDGIKIRNAKSQNATGTAKEREPLRKKGDEDLAWVEENIPSSLADTALPNILDSDEEIMNTKFEMSKME